MALLSPGIRIGEKLVVDRLLGEGAYAEVHRVRHDILGLQALKLFKRVASIEETQAMFDEARLLSTLGHPNIVRVFDASTIETREGRRGFFTMEYIAYGSLERLLAAHAPAAVPIEVAVEVIEQTIAGLSVAHRQSPPIVHRDLTLANVLVGYDENRMRVRVSDFGLAKAADPMTQLASAKGTYAFMAPEVQRLEGYSRASDVWSVGVIAYLLLTGHHPYHDGSPYDSFSLARFRHPAQPLSNFNDQVDSGLDGIVLGMLERDPAARFASAQDVAERLRKRQEAVARAPASARRATTPGLSDRGATAREARAEELVARALELARNPMTLPKAADLLEEAVNLSSAIRERYLYRLTLWRRGVMA